MPKIGLRNIKTCISVAFCLAIYFIIILIAHIFSTNWASNFKIATQLYTPFFACLATAYSISTDRDSSINAAKLRLSASIIGGLFGLAVVSIYQIFAEWPFQHISVTGNPTTDETGLFLTGFLGGNPFTEADINGAFLASFIVPVILTVLSVIGVIWFCNLIKKPQCSFIAVLTLTAVMSSLGTNPVIYGPNRILSTVIGILVALAVNKIKLPHFKNKNKLFIVSMDGIFVHDNEAVNGFNAYKINNLIEDGADITYFSTRTPVSMMPMVGRVNSNNPVICMSGAALYDAKNYKYLYTENLDIDLVVRLNRLFKNVNVSPFVNLVDDDVLYTYNERLDNPGEELYAKNRKNSAYGCYITGSAPHTKDVLYYVLVETPEKIKEVIDSINNEKFKDQVLMQVYDCYEITGSEACNGYHYLKIYSAKVKDLKCLDYLNKNKKEVVGLGTHVNDEILLKNSDIFVTTSYASKNIIDEADIVLSAKNSEKLFKKIDKIYHSKN